MKRGWFVELSLTLDGVTLTGHDMAELIKKSQVAGQVYVATSQHQPDDTQRRMFLIYSDLETEIIQSRLHQSLPNRSGILQAAPEHLQPKE